MKTTMKTTEVNALEGLSKFTALKHQCQIFVPSTMDAVENVDSSEFVKFVETELALLFGGYTSYQANGGWVSDEHGLIKEGVTVVTANFKKLTSDAVNAIVDIAKKLCKDMAQECVSVVVDGKLYFVE